MDETRSWRQYVAQIDDGRATIEHLRADMTEARTAYEDLSRSTMELMGKAQQDGGQWMSDKAEMRATLRDRDAEIASLRNTVIELQNTRGDTSKSHGLSHEEAQKLATSFESSQQQIRLLSAQKAELLERVIQLTSQQAPLQTPQMQPPDLPPPPPDLIMMIMMIWVQRLAICTSAPMMKKVLWRVIRVQAVRRQQFSLVLKYGRSSPEGQKF